MKSRVIAALTLAAATATSGCWGYNKSAKRGAYVLDTMMVAGGGGLIAIGVLDPPSACPTMPPDPGCNDPVLGPVSGALVAGSMLALGGLIAIVINATRPTVKTSR